jgi:hypothetical protein
MRLRKRLDELDDPYPSWRADRANRLAEFIEQLVRGVRRVTRRK